MRPADAERMLRRLGDTDRLGLVFRGLREAAELGEAHHQPGAIEDRCRHRHAEMVVDRVRGQRAEIVGGERDDALVVAAVAMRLLEIAGGDDAQRHVVQPLGDLQGARTAVERLIQLVERRLHGGHEGADLAAAPVVLQLRGDDLGLAQMFELAPAFAQLAEHRPQVETQLKTAPQRGLALRQVLQDPERLLVARAGVGQRRARGGLAAGHVQVVHRLVFELAAHGVMGKPLGVLAEPVGIELFHGLDDVAVGVAAALLQQLVIGDVVGERMGEGVLQVGKQLVV